MTSTVNDFKRYLKDNLMTFKELTPYTYEIGGKTFELYQPIIDDSGSGRKPVLFGDSFNFIGIPLNPEAKYTETSCDYIAYKFGGVWYMLTNEEMENPKLRRIKYLGNYIVDDLPTDIFLGVHGQYEILSGSGTYAEWVKKAKFLGVQSLGICELNTLAGALKFQAECDSAGIKPVIGMECSVYDVKHDIRFTVKVYVKTDKGWDTLLSINKAINCDYPKYIPLDEFKKLVKGQYNNLLIILDPKTLDHKNLDTLGIIGDDIGYVQIDPVRYNEGLRDKEYLLNLKAFFNDDRLAPILMADAWYLDKEYSSIRKRLAVIGGTHFFDSDDQYFKSNPELTEQLAELLPCNERGDEALFLMAETLKSLREEVKQVTFRIETKNRHLPKYKMLPEEAAKYKTNEDLFDGLIADGLARHPELIEKWGEDVVRERIDREKGVISLGAAIDYFLITRDIINWCHRNDIMTGVSRGSAGGCLVSYLLGITKLNPLEYNLLFERFLNEGRVKVTLPDIDTDFPGIDRPRVKAYMEQRYGKHQVCSVGTFSALQLRAAIKDMARVYGLEFKEVNDMMKAFDESDRKPEDLFKVACGNREVKSFVMENPGLINEMMLMLAAPKAQSIHACATMIFPDDKDMFHWVPIRKQGDEYVSEWEGGEMDSAGFLKNDILGVKQLDKFQDIVRLIRENQGVDVDIFNVPLDDPKVYEYFCKGWNEDTFHFGSKGLTGYCKQMKPKNIEELISAISLYRPGAMENGFHEEYVALKKSREECNVRRNIHTSPEEDFANANSQVEFFVGTEDILSNTYGVFCVAEDSEVLTQRGLVKIQNIIPGKDKVKTEDGSFQTVFLKKDNGERGVVKVVSNFGRDVITTPDHKFLTKRGWIEAQNLKHNDELCCWFEQPEKKDNLSEKEAIEHWLVGYFLAEGTCAPSPYFSVSNLDIAVKVKDLILRIMPDAIVDIKTYEHTHKSGRVGVSTRVFVKGRHGNNGFFNKDYIPNPLTQLLKKWGVWGQTCYTKRLPKNYSLDMLVGLIEGDGCLKNYTLKMCNKELQKDVYMGLQSYGIHSAMTEKGGNFIVSWNDLYNRFPLRLFQHRKLSRKSSTNYRYGRVKRVECLDSLKRVYDLSVENVHSFTVNGCVVANCYQEQIMELCKKLGGLSLVEADDVRKAMVKKKYEALAQYHKRFTPYYMENFGVTEEYAEEVWNAIDKASTYLFNRSHAAAYAITGYISQWLKVYYPTEYWSVAFKYAETTDYARYIAEIKDAGTCEPKSVDINASTMGVTIKNNNLYWSLLGVKQVAEKAAEQIIRVRENSDLKRYIDFDDFVASHKMKGSAVNSRVIKNLILAGAFDAVEGLTSVRDRIDLFCRYTSSLKSKGDDADDLVKQARIHKNDDWWWSLLQKQTSGLAFFDYVGLVEAIGDSDKYPFFNLEEHDGMEGIPSNGKITVGGILVDVERKQIKRKQADNDESKGGKKHEKNNYMYRLLIEQNYRFIEVVFFATEAARLDEQYGGIMQFKGQIVFINGECYFDNRKQNRALRGNADTEIISLEL